MDVFSGGWGNALVGVLVGAGISTAGRRRDDRRTAARELTELQRLVWTKGGPDDWINMRIGVDQAALSLRAVGVPQRLTDWLARAATTMWIGLQKVDLGADGAVWADLDENEFQLTLARNAILDWSHRAWAVHRKYVALRLYKHYGRSFVTAHEARRRSGNTFM